MYNTKEKEKGMFEFINSTTLFLAQTGSEKKLTFLYILLFVLFLMLLFLDARTKKHYVGSTIVKNTVLFLLFLAAIGLLIAYFRL